MTDDKTDDMTDDTDDKTDDTAERSSQPAEAVELTGDPAAPSAACWSAISRWPGSCAPLRRPSPPCSTTSHRT